MKPSLKKAIRSIPHWVKSGLLEWGVLASATGLLLSPIVYPQMQLWAITSAPLLTLSEPFARRHKEEILSRNETRRLRVHKRLDSIEATYQPHKSQGKLARVIDQTQLLIQRAIEFDSTMQVAPMGGGKKSYRYRRYFFKVLGEDRFSDLLGTASKIERMLSLAKIESVVIHPSLINNNGVGVDIGLPENEWTFPVIDSYLGSITQTRRIIPIGISDADELTTIDLTREEVSAILIGGLPGSGKSNYLRSVARWIVHYYPPSVQELHLADLKNPGESPTFGDFAGIPHVKTIATTPEELIDLLDKLELERRYRQQLFSEAGLREKNITEYLKLYPGGMSEILVLADEVAEIPTVKMASKAQMSVAKDFETKSANLNRKGRSAGIRIIWGFHRTSQEDIPLLLRSTCSHQLCFKVRDARNAALVLGLELEDAAIHIPPSLTGKGELIYNGRRYMALYTDQIPDELDIATDVIEVPARTPQSVPKQITNQESQPKPIPTKFTVKDEDATTNERGRIETMGALYRKYREYNVAAEGHSFSKFVTSLGSSNRSYQKTTAQLIEAIERFSRPDIQTWLGMAEVEDKSPHALLVGLYGETVAKQKSYSTHKLPWAEKVIAEILGEKE